MKLFLSQFRILFWKNWLLKKRHARLTFFEIFLPLISSIMMVVTISSIDSNKQQNVTSNSLGDDEQAIIKFPRPVYNLTANLNWFAHKEKLRFYYTPPNKCTEKFMKFFDHEAKSHQTNKLSVEYWPLKYPEQLDKQFTQLKSNKTVMIGLIFHNTCDNDYKSFLKNFTVTLRALGPMAINFKAIFPDKLITGPSNQTYYTEMIGFLESQIFLNMAYLRSVEEIQGTKRKLDIKNVIIYRYPFFNYLDKPPLALLDMVPNVIIYSFLIFFPLIVRQITAEKHNRVRDMFSLMGLSDGAYYSSTFLIYFLEYIIQASILTFIYTYPFRVHAAFQATSPSVLFLILLFFGINLILFAFLISVFFNTGSVAIITAILLYIIIDIAQHFIDPKYNKALSPDIPILKIVQIAFCILPAPALKFAMRVFTYLEWYSSGTDFSNLFEATHQYGDLSIGLILILNGCTTASFLVLIWYFNACWLLQYGIVRPWYFPLNPLLRPFRGEDAEKSGGIDETKETSTKYFEEENTRNKVKVSIRNLHKVFGKKRALTNINLNLYENQLTALLGHNGAGKTTLMNIVTGLEKATRGNVLINKVNIKKDPAKARKSMGLCPQHNILYDELTAYEHLAIYGIIKGAKAAELEKEINHLLKSLHLEDKRNERTLTYSGGMKRKLNLAIALIAKSNIVVLDEPTCGIDSQSRRAVWDVIIKERRGRTILMSTHFIEEADVLGDRIFILAKGRPRCCATPIYLKNIFGFGYQLRISKDLQFNDNPETRATLHSLIQEFFQNATVMSENVGEIIYSFDKKDSSREESSQTLFAQFFTKFEEMSGSLHINTFGVSSITLEDVFLKILYMSNQEPTPSRLKMSSESGKDEFVNAFFDEQCVQTTKGSFALFCQKFKALVIKRLHHSKRYYPTIIFQLVIPSLIFFLIFELDSYLRPNLQKKHALPLNLHKLYGKTNGFFKDNMNDTNFFRSYNKTAANSFMKIDHLPWHQEINEFIANKSQRDTLSKFAKNQLFGAVIHRVPGESSASLKLNLEIWFNNEASHSLPLALSVVYSSLLEYVNKLNVCDYREVELINQPFPNLGALHNAHKIIRGGMTIMWSLLVSISLPFVAASFSLLPIQEYISKSKLLQKMSSNSFIYWQTTFLCDLVGFLPSVGCILLVFLIQDKNKLFVEFEESMLMLLIIFLLFGIASMQISYTLSRAFSSVSSGFMAVVICNLAFGVVLVMFDFFFDYLNNDLSASNRDILDWIFSFFPIYAASRAIGSLYLSGSKSHMCDHLYSFGISRYCNTTYRPIYVVESCCLDSCGDLCFKYENPFQDKMVLRRLIALGCVTLCAFIINLGIEENVFLLLAYLIPNFKRCVVIIRTNSLEEETLNQDTDVMEEKWKVGKLLEKSDRTTNLLVHKLTKTFGGQIAVDDLSFALNESECFGLLGVNGAGKSTTFGMLVGDLLPDAGNAYIKNVNLRDNLKNYQQKIGFCPQNDALIDNLTGEEMLYLFGRLRGIPEVHLKQNVEFVLRMVDLKKHAKFICSNYSGGNKRKLCLGMALIGLPKIILLDEPTSGVDSEARRKIWKTLSLIRERFLCSIVLTSHSMDECEALCNRIAIMCAGKFKCLNSVQNLRKKYGKGFRLTIKLKAGCFDQVYFLKNLRRRIKTVFPSAVLKEAREGLLDYQIEEPSLKWSFMFGQMDQIKSANQQIEYFLLSDSTLESIFLEMAKANTRR